jgi:hypothetical protein
MKASFALAAIMALTVVGAHAGNLSKDSLVQCTPALCGDFPANQATMSVGKGSNVTVGSTGLVTVTIFSLRDKATGAIVGNKPLRLLYGTLMNPNIHVIELGAFSTDANGNYSGTVTMADGNAYAFPAGASYTGSFFVNDDAIPNTQFSTGFTVR